MEDCYDLKTIDEVDLVSLDQPFSFPKYQRRENRDFINLQICTDNIMNEVLHIFDILIFRNFAAPKLQFESRERLRHAVGSCVPTRMLSIVLPEHISSGRLVRVIGDEFDEGRSIKIVNLY